eukprot:CAMPEP_0195514646 /NCGR_PEP_ID=MMETSP0794_2-20130614/5969_1 /TAXON_ID=515487 /ORGANISM="Stephanopyxis turris, Strain CCMP 815" /LENGTH=296 /DNA_ID=CAMNT_0040642927 /DNA_START=124 /DNA_END=1014 /DNA_ORIENTATION=-
MKMTTNHKNAQETTPTSLSPQTNKMKESPQRLNRKQLHHRRSFMDKIGVFVTSSAMTTTAFSNPAQALVKGNAPPPKKSSSVEKKCINVEQCQEMADLEQDKELAKLKENAKPLSTAPGGSRYVDMEEGKADGKIAKKGNVATIRYKVLKLGKRSYDGVSGEGTVVFSRGYGLEDDETAPNQKSFTFTISDPQVILALSDGILGMKEGGTRRIGILPQMGWERADKLCDGGPGGKSAGGDLKTDYVIVPTATMVATETCFDKSKLPFPSTYAEQRRMAQRFDQSLIVELELVEIKE